MQTWPSLRFAINREAVREANRGGLSFLVVPVVAVQQQVLNGELLTAEAIRNSLPDWEGQPVTFDHPPDVCPENLDTEAAYLDFLACQNREIEKLKIGEFRNVRIAEGSKLQGEFWLPLPPATPEIGQIHDAFRAGQMIDVSTGYMAHVVPVEGTHNGKAYGLKQVAIAPNHVAVLTKDVGACSIEDGCGAPRWNRMREQIAGHYGVKMTTNALDLRTAEGRRIKKALEEKYSGKYKKFSLAEVHKDYALFDGDGARYRVPYNTATVDGEDVVLLGRAKKNQDDPRQNRLFLRGSLDERLNLVSAAIEERFRPRVPDDMDAVWPMIEGVFDDHAAFTLGKDAYTIGYEIEDDEVKLAEPVIVEVTLAPAANKQTLGQRLTAFVTKLFGEPKMNKTELIKQIANARGLDAEEAKALEALPDSVLQKMTANAEAAPKPAEKPAEKVDEKADLITTIRANQASQFTPEQLTAMPVCALKSLAATLNEAAKAPALTEEAVLAALPWLAEAKAKANSDTEAAKVKHSEAVTRLKANKKAAAFTEPQLAAMTLDQLEALERSIMPANYTGAAAPVAGQQRENALTEQFRSAWPGAPIEKVN